MPESLFKPDMRVSSRRDLKPCRDKRSVIVQRFAKGTVVHVSTRFVYVEFDGMDHEVRVAPGDLLPLTTDELFAVNPEYWDVIRPGGNDAA